MTTYSFPAVTPNEMRLQFVSNTNIFRSPLSGAMQTEDRSGEYLGAVIEYQNMSTADKALIMSLLAKLNGQQHRVSLPFHALDNRGAFGGTPLVAGASQTGTSINVDGCSLSITNWIREGDVFSFGDGLKICTADANSDGAGAITISFWPRIRTAPADNTAIETTTPVGTFMLASNSNEMGFRPGIFADASLAFIEDIAA